MLSRLKRIKLVKEKPPALAGSSRRGNLDTAGEGRANEVRIFWQRRGCPAGKALAARGAWRKLYKIKEQNDLKEGSSFLKKLARCHRKRMGNCLYR